MSKSKAQKKVLMRKGVAIAIAGVLALSMISALIIQVIALF